MVIPDWLVNLLQKRGLLSSEPQRIEQKIAKLEDERREIRSKISDMLKDLQKTKMEYRVLFPKFQTAQEPEKGLLAIELRSLKNKIENGTAELTELIQNRVKVLDALIQTENMKKFAIEHGIRVEDIEDATIFKEEYSEMLSEEVSALDDLTSTKIVNSNTDKSYENLTESKPANDYSDLVGPSSEKENSQTETLKA